MTEPESENAERLPLPTPRVFAQLMELPLYQRHELIGRDPNDQARALRLYERKFDMYCPSCAKETTWSPVVSSELKLQQTNYQKRSKLDPMGGGRTLPPDWLGDFTLSVVCGRNDEHRADFHFVTERSVLTAMQALERLEGKKAPPDLVWLVKIGQHPSLTDFQLGDLREFEEGMTKEQRKEFVRATNSTAHGFFVAACVYFRRVFESVLKEAKIEYMKQHSKSAWPEFEQARTDERIRLLREHLPPFMSEHPELYGVLSLGVHELTEEQCAGELPMLRQAIELIMRDRVTLARQKRQRGDVAKLLAKSVDRHKNGR